MCTGIEIAMLAGAAVSAVGTVQAAGENSQARQTQAAEESQAAEDHARAIRDATRRRVGAARAATAASGTALDEFSTINTREIENLGGSDEAMTILTGRRRSSALSRQADNEQSAGLFDAFGGLAQAGGSAYSGWKGAKGPKGGGTIGGY
jgi:hypothetical protein